MYVILPFVMESLVHTRRTSDDRSIANRSRREVSEAFVHFGEQALAYAFVGNVHAMGYCEENGIMIVDFRAAAKRVRRARAQLRSEQGHP